MLDLFIIITSFAAIFSLIYFFFMDKELDSTIQRRLTDLKEGELNARKNNSDNPNQIYEALSKKEQNKKTTILEMLKDHSEYRLPIIGLFLSKFSFIDKVKDLLKRADVKMPIDVFFMLVGFFVAPFLILTLLTGNFLLLFVGFGTGAIPFLYLQFKFKNRLKLFDKYFPDSLGIVSNSLRAGHSLLASFQMVAGESPYPVNKLFKTVSDEISLGREVRETMEDMDSHMPGSQDLKFFITAVLIQKEIGGNLAEILDTLSITMREREKLLGMIKAQTAQAQLSGMVLGMMPVAITGLVTAMNPSYMAPLFNTTIGKLALFLSFSMSFIGFIVIQKITQIRV